MFTMNMRGEGEGEGEGKGDGMQGQHNGNTSGIDREVFPIINSMNLLV